MSRVWQSLLLGLLAIAFAAAGFALYQWRAGDGRDGAAGAGALLTTPLKGLDDQPLTIERWRGKVLVVNFWATWCAPCREEIPLFMKFQQDYEARGVQFLGIAVDQKARVAPYAKEMGINYPLLIGGLEAIDLSRKAGNAAGVLPFTVVLDRRGDIASKFIGIAQPAKLEAILHPLLKD